MTTTKVNARELLGAMEYLAAHGDETSPESFIAVARSLGWVAPAVAPDTVERACVEWAEARRADPIDVPRLARAEAAILAAVSALDHQPPVRAETYTRAEVLAFAVRVREATNDAAGVVGYLPDETLESMLDTPPGAGK